MEEQKTEEAKQDNIAEEANQAKQEDAVETQKTEAEMQKCEEKGAENCCESENKVKKSVPWGVIFVFLGVMIISFIYFKFGKGIENVSLDQNVALPVLFLIGLVTGVHCVGMCGSFVVAYSSKHKMAGIEDKHAHLKYGAGKLISYTAIGGIFGLIGSVLSFTPQLRGTVGLLAGAFLIIYGLNMLNIFPILRKLQLRLPFSNPDEGGGQKEPFRIGLANGLFIACGPLQAMYIYAAGTGSMLDGALSLFAYGLGTLPFMLMFAYGISAFSKHMHKIMKFSGVLILVLGLVMTNNGLNLLGVSVIGKGSTGGANSSISEDVQTIRMTVDAYGWSPDTFTLKKGVKVRWIIDVKELTGCNKEIIVQDYGLDIKLKEGENIVEFTPTKAGTVAWSCWMGMIPGTFRVVE